MLTSSILERPCDTTLRARFFPGLAKLAAAAWRWYRLRRDARRLEAFSDHLLRDIALGRGEIEQAVRNGRER